MFGKKMSDLTLCNFSDHISDNILFSVFFLFFIKDFCLMFAVNINNKGYESQSFCWDSMTSQWIVKVDSTYHVKLDFKKSEVVSVLAAVEIQCCHNWKMESLLCLVQLKPEDWDVLCSCLCSNRRPKHRQEAGKVKSRTDALWKATDRKYRWKKVRRIRNMADDRAMMRDNRRTHQGVN